MEVGKHCAFTGCSQLDFLPFTCGSCKEFFCLEHRTPIAHHCEKWSAKDKVVSICHKCHAILPSDKTEDLEAHLATCSPTTAKTQCSLATCHQLTLFPSTCLKCHDKFCLQHRHPPDHQCPGPKNQDKEKPAVLKEFERQMLERAAQKPNTSAVKTKVKKKNLTLELMKLKQKATGDQSVPQPSRIYLWVHLPKPASSPIPLFFSKEHTIGRMVDSISVAGNVKNVNNNGDASQRLTLFDAQNGVALSNTATMDALVKEKVLSNGGDIIMERGAVKIDPSDYV
ncbi:hypothetical protein BC832DRAFT_557649 [Gaertneriomyces semiglobifer]|nr:hypothetical protein BC832DRAFT_557649 [Gaertneriomyces semiglobifer]